MVSVLYSEAITEVLDILSHTRKEDVEKIPKKFMKYLEDNKSKDYTPNLDHSKSIKDMGIKPKTAALLGMIYVKYWANAEEKEEFLKKATENEKIYQEELNIKYNPNEIFKTKNNNYKENIIDENLPTVQEKNTNVFARIWNKIKSFLGINNK